MKHICFDQFSDYWMVYVVWIDVECIYNINIHNGSMTMPTYKEAPKAPEEAKEPPKVVSQRPSQLTREDILKLLAGRERQLNEFSKGISNYMTVLRIGMLNPFMIGISLTRLKVHGELCAAIEQNLKFGLSLNKALANITASLPANTREIKPEELMEPEKVRARFSDTMKVAVEQLEPLLPGIGKFRQPLVDSVRRLKELANLNTEWTLKEVNEFSSIGAGLRSELKIIFDRIDTDCQRGMAIMEQMGKSMGPIAEVGKNVLSGLVANHAQIAAQMETRLKPIINISIRAISPEVEFNRDLPARYAMVTCGEQNA